MSCLEPCRLPVSTAPPSVSATSCSSSGAGPVRPDGTVVTGKVGADLDVAAAVEAARLTGLQLLAALQRSWAASTTSARW